MTKLATLTEVERAEKRAADREYARQAVEALRSSDGWRRWLTTRASFHRYSLTNQFLIAMQRPEAVYVAGFKKWLALGYCVKKGEKAIRIWAPVPPSAKKLAEWRAAGAIADERPRTHFRLTNVFGDDQVGELPPPAQPQPLRPPIRQLEGEDLVEQLPALEALAAEIGSTVTYQPIAGGACGYYVPADKRIVIDADMAGNARVSVLCHELAHALVRADHQDDDPKLDYASEELVVESVAFTVIRSLGIDADAASIPYLASWAESSELSVLEKTAALIDRLAKRLQDALEPVDVDDTQAVDEQLSTVASNDTTTGEGQLLRLRRAAPLSVPPVLPTPVKVGPFGPGCAGR